MTRHLLEVPVFTMEAAMLASQYADRLEVCDGPQEGGTTPSFGMVKVLSNRISVPIRIMIRPRGGDFNYSVEEFEVMKSDIHHFKSLNIEGFVFGILDENLDLDKNRCEELIKRAGPFPVTLHRAIDVSADPLTGLEDAISLGYDRILTSGGKPKAEEGVTLIRTMVEQANDRIKIMAGSGLNSTNLQRVIKETGVKEVHLSARKEVARQKSGSAIDPKYLSVNLDELRLIKNTLNKL